MEQVVVAGDLPNLRVHDDRAVQADHFVGRGGAGRDQQLVVAGDHVPPPGLADVPLEFHAHRPVVPKALQTAVNLARLEEKSAPLAQGDQLVHFHGCHPESISKGGKHGEPIPEPCRGSCGGGSRDGFCDRFLSLAHRFKLGQWAGVGRSRVGPDPGHPGHPGHPLAGRGSRVGERRPTLQRISGTTVARASTAIGAKVNVAAAARFRERKVTRRTPVAASGDSGAAAAKTRNAPCGSCRMEPIGPAAGPGTLGLASGCP